MSDYDDAPPRGRPAGVPRVPPHNLQAEESLLGAMLLSKDAISMASELLGADDFYKPAHGYIFDAITALTAAGEPADPVTVAEELRRSDLLEGIGGAATLVALQGNTPAVSNAARYAKIIEEHSLLRRLIGVAGEIAEIGYDLPDDVAKAVDTAESMVFEVAQRRVTDTMAPIHDLLDKNLDRLEALYELGAAITGTPTGFVDLDDITSGLQPQALIVVGARPSMGKTAFALSLATHAALEGNKPVLIFSLEMGQIELTQRILCAEAKVDSKKLRNGSLNEADWSKISHGMGRLAEAPLWIDDNPNLTIMEIRSKARRLQQRVGKLGLIIVDYLQLMTGRSSAENRQVEVSEISRGLKILARELDCPVMALSQLSRGLEMRADKRPMLADLRESGCLTADTVLTRADTNALVTLGELLSTGERNVPVWSLDDEGRIQAATLTHAFPSGTKRVFELKLASGRTVRATANHRFRTPHGWVHLEDLHQGDHLAVPRLLPTPLEPTAMPDAEVVMLAHLLGGGTVLPRQPIHYTNCDEANLAAVEEAAEHFGITPRRVAQQTWQHVYLPSPHHLTHGVRNPVHAWWIGLGLYDCRSWQKFIPAPVFGLDDRQLALFIRHLWATDGSVHLRDTASGRAAVRVSYASTSRQLVDGLQQLLLRFRIQSRIRASQKGDHRPSYSLDIVGSENQRTFFGEIGVHGARGEIADRARSVVAARVPNPNVDTVPHSIRPRVAAALATANVTHRALANALGEDDCGSYLLGSPARPRSFSRRRLAKIAEVTGDPELRALATSDVAWDAIASITPVGTADVYDATVLGTHNFVANGIVAHNSIEQDADIVMFIYRDEVYTADSPDRGTAEIIVAKQRNGPTGVARLAFLDHYTKFANMARGV
jgi:replicative DNA helicase